MAKRNRRRKTFQLKPATIGWAALILVTLGPWLAYCLYGLSNDQLATQVKLLEADKRSQEESLHRITLEKEQLMEPNQLNEAVQRNGLQLAYALPERCVMVSETGTMKMSSTLRNQLVLAQNKALGKPTETKTAMVKPQTTRRRARR